MSSPFYLQGSRSIRNLSEEETLSESDFEHMCPADGDEMSEAVHSWYGRLSFTHRLAQSIIHDIGPVNTVDELEVSTTDPRRLMAYFCHRILTFWCS